MEFDDEFEGLLEPEGAQDMIIELSIAESIEALIRGENNLKRGIIRTLLQQFTPDARIRILNIPEFHALTAAIETGQNELIPFLITFGPDVLSLNARGINSFTVAIQSKNTGVLPELFSRIPDNVGNRLNTIHQVRFDILREMEIVETSARLQTLHTISSLERSLISSLANNQLNALNAMLNQVNRMEDAIKGRVIPRGQLRTQFGKKKVNKKSRKRKIN